MTAQKVVTDEQIGKVARKQWELFRRVKEGTLDADEICSALQGLIESNLLSFNVIIDYDLLLEQMIKAGKYDWVNDDITADHFPVKGKGKKEKIITLFHFNKAMTSEEVIAEMDKEGFLPANIEDILALGGFQPELQKRFPIVALGSVWRGVGGAPYVPCGWGRLDRFDRSWRSGYRFLAVCK